MDQLLYKWLVEVYERPMMAIKLSGVVAAPMFEHLAPRTRYDVARAMMTRLVLSRQLIRAGNSWFIA